MAIGLVVSLVVPYQRHTVVLALTNHGSCVVEPLDWWLADYGYCRELQHIGFNIRVITFGIRVHGRNSPALVYA